MDRQSTIDFRPTIALATLMIIGVVGTVHFLATQAATPTVALEPEKGMLSPGATVVNDSTASGGSAVKFPAPLNPGGDATIMAAGDFNGGTEAGRTFATMKAQNPAAILGLGDFQYNGSNVGDPATGGFNTQIGSLKAITYPTAGPTHDIQGTSPSGPYQNYWGRSPFALYSFNLGNWHIISLPSASFRYGVNVSAIQSQLDADLAADKHPCTLAFWHEPYWTLSTSGHNSRDEPGESAWIQSLYNHNADLILTGHQHDYQRYGPNDPSGKLDPARGIPEFVIGTGGVGFYTFNGVNNADAPNLIFSNASTYGSVKFILHSNGYDFTFLPNGGGAPLDSGSGTCH